ncbi:MAG: DUF2911 domain-containing protein [Bacteroidota bacterium]|nr:DUF2911 domain-containing protein [Bacteroidota bacterium]
MKKILTALMVLMMGAPSISQVRTPAASPQGKVQQTVGLTNVSVEYSRPSTKGRNIFGNLVPFGKMWRTGANANTIVSFGDDVVIDGKTLPKGDYALYMNPKPDLWEVFFYTDTHNWGLPEKWNEEKVALKTTVKPTNLNVNVETFTIGINNLDNDFGHLEVSWEKTLITIKFNVPTSKIANASIEKALAGPDAETYYNAANYYYQANSDMHKALEWINKAVEMRGDQTPFWYYRLKSLIQAKTGDKKGAIETAHRSLDLAEKAGNSDYIKLNRDSIQEWSK